MTKKTLLGNSARLGVVDSLRGFALLAIVLLHNLEHYNIYFIPDWLPDWIKSFDRGVWDTLFFTLAGKAYATFSLLFGFSFYVQLRNERARGGDFRPRFAWRMFILILIAQLHSLFYNGDILLLYAVVGLTLIPVANLKDRTVFVIATICILQPFEWGRIIAASINPEWTLSGEMWRPYAALAYPVMKDGNFWELLKSNITVGQLYNNFWQLEAGRVFQSAGLFMYGMLLGRRDYFVRSEGAKKFWKKILLVAVIAFVPFYLMKSYIPDMVADNGLKTSLDIVLPSLWNFAVMAFYVASFTLLWFARDGCRIQRAMTPYGRMSLTNYVTQSIIGVAIYYGYGLSLWKYTGASATVVIGFAIFFAQLIFSRWWLSKYRQGPLEYLWRRGTWLGRAV
ncbi:conserved hypothetical protein, putative transport protein [Mucinivorans hirudinis]|uniref:DUF418 domain-containing protein n=1 Tax=Mucinivorans hirudinis TaxID=1433126 RepID=A0A060RD76_9BACT|nr:conserved hypothetical protein, putative transport protein [Mucinivorans hirudinis]